MPVPGGTRRGWANVRWSLDAGPTDGTAPTVEGAGLLSRRRYRHEVYYRRTALGRSLADGLMPGE